MEIYEARARLTALLAAIYPSYFGSDPGEPDWPVLYIETDAGQLSWHINKKDMHLFEHVVIVEDGPSWDGHSTEEKYRRIESLIKEIS